MKKELLTYFFFLSTVCFLFISGSVQAINLCRWQGYANKSGNAVNTSDYIKAYNGTKTYNATIFSDGFYIADVQAESTDVTISFKICGVAADQGGQAWSCPASDYNTLNLSITALSDDVACSYSCACSGHYCCDGATEYTDGSGSGTCQSSACSAATTPTTAPGGGGGGGGGGATTTTNTTSTTAATTVATTVETTRPTTVETIEPACGKEGDTCGKDYPECCEGLTCKKKVCTPKKEKPVIPLEMPAVESWMVIGIAFGVIAVIIVVILLLARRPPTPELPSAPPIPPIP